MVCQFELFNWVSRCANVVALTCKSRGGKKPVRLWMSMAGFQSAIILHEFVFVWQCCCLLFFDKYCCLLFIAFVGL
uniref:Uncharacterized protein n=1 Tax=Nelumbo nucifera TaxID=4432 RepID=A0A822Z202_NELNU|nr:TPA_asm: hypothetical protein HUJ06_013032 [Nelumbo nucifera]